MPLLPRRGAGSTIRHCATAPPVTATASEAIDLSKRFGAVPGRWIRSSGIDAAEIFGFLGSRHVAKQLR